MPTEQMSQSQIHELIHPIFEDVKESFGVVLTRTHIPVIIFTRKAGEPDGCCVAGMYWNNNTWIPSKWYADGKWPSKDNKKCDLDLLLKPTDYEDIVA